MADYLWLTPREIQHSCCDRAKICYEGTVTDTRSMGHVRCNSVDFGYIGDKWKMPAKNTMTEKRETICIEMSLCCHTVCGSTLSVAING